MSLPNAQTNNMKVKLLLPICFIGFLLFNFAKAQTTNYPYPQNRDYAYGFQQNSVTKAAAAAIAESWYNDWKTRWVESCGGGVYRVKDGGGQSFSEGIGYGMLLAAYRGDKTLFDGLWQYYKNNVNSNGLMNWCRSNCGGSSCGNNGATDGDLDAAMALIIANCQWGTYTTDATNLITNIKNYEFTTCGTLTVQKPGDAFGGCNCTNPSYFAPGYYRAFADFIPSQSAFWTKAADDSYTILLGSAHATTGLIPAWSDSNSGLGGTGDCNSIAASGGGTRTDYQFDAARAPWRIATDYLWWGTADAKTWLTKITTWVKTGPGISGVVAGYQRSGTANVSYKNSAFTGAFALGAMASSQADVNSFFSWWTTHSVTSGSVGSDLDDQPYFQNSLRTIYALLATGNMWYPCSKTPPCQTPSLGADVSTCGSSFPFQLNSNTPAGSSIRFTWKKISPAVSILVNSSSNTADNKYSVTAANGAGTYVVIRDSLDAANAVTCTKSDTIIISSTLPLPVISPTGPVNLCNPASVDLSVSNGAAFPASTTWQWSLDGNSITGEEAKTLLNVRKAGVYKITASISGCADTEASITVTSSMPLPVDGCASTAPIKLSIASATGGPYNWYATATSTTALATGVTTFNAPSAGTYYVQDMSSAAGSAGPTNALGGATNWGAAPAGNVLLFAVTKDFTLNSFKVPFGNIYAGNSTATITVEIVNSSGAPLSPVRTFTSDPVNVTTAMANSMITFSFTGLDIKAAWGANLGMRISALNLNGEPLWNSTGASYPYVSNPSGIVSFTGTLGGDADANDYMYFYDWKISTGNNCSRLPVIATTGTGCETSPVRLLEFKGIRESNVTSLSWITASEENSSYFEVQRSVNGTDFTGIGQVSAAGASSSILYYTFEDSYPVNGLFYYRLKQVDYDGSQELSKIVSVSNEDQTRLSLVPNPFQKSSQLAVISPYSSSYSVFVVDLSGMVVETFENLGIEEKVEIGASLSPGMYLLKVIVNGKTYHLKMVKN